MNFRPNFETKEDRKSKVAEYEPVRNYMVPAKDLITFAPDQDVEEVIDVILKNRISGAPVLESDGKLVGIISEKDCLKLMIDRAYHNLPLEDRKVAKYMTKVVKTIDPDKDVVTAANEFLNAPVRRFPVCENGVLIGQISRRNVLQAAQKISSTTW